MRDTLLGHKPPDLRVVAHFADGTEEWAAWSLEQARSFFSSAQAEGATKVEVFTTPGDRLLWWYPCEDDFVDRDGACDGDEGGFALMKRRHRG